MVRLPPQSKEEIDRIRKQSEEEFLYLKKEDVKQQRQIRQYLDGDEYELSEDELIDEDFMDEGYI